MQYGGEDLEVAGILKNVYAIGFSYLKAKKSDNYAAVWFVKVWDELRGVVKKEEFLSDLVVTCMSEASRNNKAGLLLSRGEPIEFQDCQVAEGVHTAEMIEKFNLFHGLPLLREITKIVVSRQRYDEWE
jgi:glycerol-3-phosphate dehydrogenase